MKLEFGNKINETQIEVEAVVKNVELKETPPKIDDTDTRVKCCITLGIEGGGEKRFYAGYDVKDGAVVAAAYSEGMVEPFLRAIGETNLGDNCIGKRLMLKYANSVSLPITAFRPMSQSKETPKKKG